MPVDITVHQVEVSFLGRPPARRLGQAAGVSAVRVAGSALSCVVTGSFQPFLEALQGHEVLALVSKRIQEVKHV